MSSKLLELYGCCWHVIVTTTAMVICVQICIDRQIDHRGKNKCPLTKLICSQCRVNCSSYGCCCWHVIVTTTRRRRTKVVYVYMYRYTDRPSGKKCPLNKINLEDKQGLFWWVSLSIVQLLACDCDDDTTTMVIYMYRYTDTLGQKMSTHKINLEDKQGLFWWGPSIIYLSL
jgi:hypothetical protein